MVTRFLILALAALTAIPASAQNRGDERDHAGNGIQSEFYFELSKQDVRNHSIVHKFGSASNIGTSWTVVSSAKLYQMPTAATAIEAVSTSDSDSTGNAGLQSLCVQGLGSAWELVSECISLRGTQAVDFTATFFRVFRVYGDSTGTYAAVGTDSQVGTVTVRTDAGGATWATLEVVSDLGFGQSEIAAYTVPTGYTGYIKSIDIEVEATKKPDVLLIKRCNADDVVAPYTGVLRVQEVFRGVDEYVSQNFDAPLGPYPGPCDILFYAKAPSGSTTDISVDFEVLLVKD